MTQTYPFTDPNPGWAEGKKLHASEMATVSANAAQAADGLLWSDLAIAKNFTFKATVTNCGKVPIWDSFLDRWLAVGDDSTNPKAKVSTDGHDEWIDLTMGSPANWNTTKSGAVNGLGTVLIGTGGGSSTASKIRQSADGGETWTTRAMTASGSEAVADLCWFAGASLFVAVLSSAAATNIETSPTGVTWTQRTGLPNSLARTKLAASPTVVVALSSGATCLYSTDGATWVSATMPASKAWAAVAWSDQSSKFMAMALDGTIATSPDGINWTSAGTTPPIVSGGVVGLCAWRRVWLCFGMFGGYLVMRASVDNGATWLTVKTLGNSTLLAGGVAAGDNQFLFLNPNGTAYASIRGGR